MPSESGWYGELSSLSSYMPIIAARSEATRLVSRTASNAARRLSHVGGIDRHEMPLRDRRA